MTKIKEYWLSFYDWLRTRTWADYYTNIKLWARETPTGRVLDRFFRFFIITAVGAFLTNWTLGIAIIPVLQMSLGTALVATFDKIKNEFLAKSRDELDGFSTL